MVGLPTTPFVTLSEALSWIAFGDARDKMALNTELTEQAFRLGYEIAKERLIVAVASLTSAATGGHVEMLGKFLSSHDVDVGSVKTAIVMPTETLNYRQFDITADALRFGSGLAWLPDDAGVWEYTPIMRPDFYAEVVIKRTDLMRTFAKGALRAAGGKKSSLRPLPDADLKNWWNCLTPAEQALSQSGLEELCRTKFPSHRITRQRVRDLAPNRKRGPRQIGQ